MFVNNQKTEKKLYELLEYNAATSDKMCCHYCTKILKIYIQNTHKFKINIFFKIWQNFSNIADSYLII